MDKIAPGSTDAENEYTEAEKLKCEIDKLRLEARELRRPYMLQPTTWFTVVGLLISLTVNLSQCSKTKDQIEHEKVQLEKTQWENIKAKNTQDSIADQIKVLNAKATVAKIDLENATRRIDAAAQELAKKNNGKDPVFTESVAQIKRLANKAADDHIQVSSVKQINNNLALANNKELEGYQHLLDGDFPAAASAFQASEDAYNGYHWSYELAKVVKQKGNVVNAIQKKEFYKLLVSKYSRYMPPEYLKRFEALAN